MKRMQWPTLFLLSAVAILALGPRFLLPVLFADHAFTWSEPLQQLCLLLALLFNGLCYGRHVRVVPWPALVTTVFLVMSPLFGSTVGLPFEGGARVGHAVAAWIALTLPWLAVVPRYQPGARRALAWAVVSLALLSAGLGVLLHFTSEWRAFRVWDGTLYRFAGATRADYFAALAYGGIVVAVHEWSRRGSRGMGLIGTVNAILLVYSGSRTALITLGVWLGCILLLSRELRARVLVLRTGLWWAIAAVLGAFLIHFPVLRDRMAGLSEGNVSLSGRGPIWEALFGHFRQHLWFGLGLGSAQPGVLQPMLPHNEYLRLLVELGAIGAVLYLGSVLLWARRVYDRLDEGDRPYLVALMVALPLYAVTDNPISACYITPFLYLGVMMRDLDERG